MPYADPQKQRDYQNAWMQRRRTEWVQQHGPCRACGSAEDLQVDHIDPNKKVSHRIWSWSTARREAELEKCQVLCMDCHLEKTKSQRPSYEHGTNSSYMRTNTKELGCRCPECTAAHSAESRRYRERLRGKGNMPA